MRCRRSPRRLPPPRRRRRSGPAIVRQGVRALGARAATVYAMREDGESLELVASEGYPAEMMSAWERIPLDAATPLTDAIRSGEIVVCASFEEIAARYPSFERTDESFVAAPLVAAGRAIGGIFIGSAEARHYAGATSSLIVSLARQAAQALDRAQLFERERASAGQAAQAAGRDRRAVAGGHARGREPHLPRARDDGHRRAGRARRPPRRRAATPEPSASP